ncbi:hypothetical protein EBL89_15700 [Cereibacter sphaeroides]|nr:hypothetical protein EBL89_15700 [Cereibacter sphaeroides]AZB61127.1 hypothetical protein EBL88_15670 [Cereibacter sphaeroides]
MGFQIGAHAAAPPWNCRGTIPCTARLCQTGHGRRGRNIPFERMGARRARGHSSRMPGAWPLRPACESG